MGGAYPGQTTAKALMEDVGSTQEVFRRYPGDIQEAPSGTMQKATRCTGRHPGPWRHLTQFEEKLRAQFSDKRKWTIKPYMPGDTRMGTIYKLADRALQLKDILLLILNFF